MNLKYVRGLRVAEDLNQSQMADLLEISRQAYHMKETGKTSFTAEELKILSDYFGVPIDNFFKDKSDI